MSGVTQSIPEARAPYITPRCPHRPWELHQLHPRGRQSGFPQALSRSVHVPWLWWLHNYGEEQATSSPTLKRTQLTFVVRICPRKPS